MGASWQLVTAPTIEPITLAEAKLQARLTQGDDTLIHRYRVAAREQAEETLNRGLLTQTWKLVLDHWAPVIYLPRAAPLQNDANASPSTAPVVQYYATSGSLTTLSTSVYTVDTVSRPGRITLTPGQIWPTLQSMRFSGRIVITYVIGWTTAALVPERIKQGIRLYLSYLDMNRDGLAEHADQARSAAAACWDDAVPWLDPYGHSGPEAAYSQAAAWSLHRWDAYS
jgi:uncharacterized phiE125 gp8 family phage protein